LNAKKNRSKAWILGPVVLLFLVPLTILLVKRMEGHAPTVALEMESASLGADRSLTLNVADPQNGIREIWVGILKDGKETVLMDKHFPSGNIWMGGINREETFSVPVDPRAHGITDGKAKLRMVVRDYSWRQWGAGNQNYQEREVIIDTQAPEIDVVSGPLYINQGGSGVVIYKLSEDCATSGVQAGDDFYAGYHGDFKDSGVYMAFLALGYKQGRSTPLSVVATDFAGNEGRVGLQAQITPRKFKHDTIRVSDSFLDWKMPEFVSQVSDASGASMIDIFLQVNRELRRQNYEELIKYTVNPDTQLHWQGDFLRLPGAANRAGYADHRKYVYKGKTVDEQDHMGVDLASVQNSPVPAANSGKVVMVDSVGIYGNTVMIDHGFGLFSMYSHLSASNVSKGQMVAKGDIIGKTGRSGLAGGDHLHFGMFVNQTFVNPIEWWDAHWIEDNILSKIRSVQ
jgi:murein DD-endopeptidase MepM/ murein hydrolase activator NlpD